MKKLTLRLSYNGSVSNYVTYLIVLLSLFVTFISFNNSSFGAECIVLTIIILALNFKRKNFLILCPFILACMFTILLFMLSGKTGERGFNAPVNHMLKFVYLMFAVALSIGMHELSKANRTRIIKAVLVSILISVLISIFYAVTVDRYAIRYAEERGFSSVVNFAQFYGICLLLCVLFYNIFRYGKQYPVWKQFIIIIPIIACIVVSLYVTGVLLSAIGICLAFAVHKIDESKTKAALWAFIVLVILGLMIVYRTQMSDFVYRVTESFNWILKDRLRSVADTVFRTNHNLSYSHDRRDELAGYSLATFKKHPIFGIGYTGYGYEVIGGHQEWQDFLGVFGLAGIFLFILGMSFLVRATVKSIDNKNDKHAFYIAFVLFVILGFLNPCLNLPILTAVFVIAPNMSLIIPWWRKNK